MANVRGAARLGRGFGFTLLEASESLVDATREDVQPSVPLPPSKFMPRAGREVPRPRYRGRLSNLVWCCAGFIIGAAFWHAVGFWMFVSNAVLSAPNSVAAVPSQGRALESQLGQRLTPEALTAAQRVVDASPIETGSLPSRTDCVGLLLDRSKGLTTLTTCDGAGPHVHSGEALKRADFQPSR